MDGWNDCFSFEKWKAAFEECGLSMEFYANRRRSYDEISPWSMIDMLVSKDFLIKENERAHQSEPTPNCREKCSGCGVRDCPVHKKA